MVIALLLSKSGCVERVGGMRHTALLQNPNDSRSAWVSGHHKTLGITMLRQMLLTNVVADLSNFCNSFTAKPASTAH